MKETDNNPVVTVVMATYNEPEKIICQSIKSILNQTLSDFEFLIIDDSTSKETVDAINGFKQDPRIRIIREPERLGFVKALNTGLRNARGKYIARMDGDDIAMLNRLELQVAFLDKNLKYSVIGGAMNIIDYQGNITSHRSYPSSSFKLAAWTIFRCPIAHPTAMFRKSIIDRGYFYDENFRKAEDIEFWLRLMKNGIVLSNLSETILNFRVTEDLSIKRTKEHYRFYFKARIKNFSWKHPVRSTLSAVVTKSYLLLPNFIVKKIYSFENKQ
jgi:glycosyltransferase EpsE